MAVRGMREGLPRGEKGDQAGFGRPTPWKKGGSMNSMKRYVLSGLAASGLALALAATGYAQAHEVEAKIPFEFAVSGKVLPDGAYFMTRDITGPLKIASLNGNNVALALVTHTQSNTPRKEATLVFERVGDHYFLAQIWEPGNDAGVQIPRSKMERELIKRTLARSSGGEHQAGPELVYITGRVP